MKTYTTMRLIIGVLCLVTLLKQCNCVIYYLNETEYNRMPPIYQLDDYDACLQTPNDVYCTVSYSLVSDEPSELLHMIQEYSVHTSTHLNHTSIRYSMCVTQTCQPYIENKTTVSSETLEECLNHSLWMNYKLKTKVNKQLCHRLTDTFTVDADDIVVAIVLLGILTLNVIGTIKDIKSVSSDKQVKNVWSCFSLRKNWKRLVSISNTNTDARLHRLKGINGLRCVIVFGVITVHCSWPFLVSINNIHDFELKYYNVVFLIICNATMGMQAFLVISGFLMSYKTELISEKSKISWSFVPKGILLRYFRLTPVYAIIIAVLATWVKFIKYGPLWDVALREPTTQCRTRWWENLLYINNYFYDSQCVAVAWYLGVDMQMFILGLITCVALRNKRWRTLVLTTLFIIGMLLPAIHTYMRDLDGHLHLFPGTTRSMFKWDPTFNETYKMGHANISSYIVGLALGYIVYRTQQMNIDIKKYQKYKVILWALPVLTVAVFFSGSIFYRDAPRDSIYFRTLYAALAKPVVGIIVALFLYGLIFRIENVYRRFLELNIWVVPSRLSYCVYLIHMPCLRLYISLIRTLMMFTLLNQLLMLSCLVLASFVLSFPLYLMFEAPFVELTKYFSSPSKEKEPIEKSTDNCHEKNENNTFL